MTLKTNWLLMKKYDLTDLTFLIPIKLDSIIRIENLLASIQSINKYFDTNIFVLESNAYKHDILKKLLPRKTTFFFVKDRDPIFYRTHFLNFLALKAKTKFIAIWDADVIIPPHQIIESIENLRNENCDVSFPYDGDFYDTTRIIRELYLSTRKINVLTENLSKMLLPYGRNMGGGAIIIKKQSFINAGMENENFYGWGPEDWERFERWQNLNYKIVRTKGPLFHLTHPRDINGTHNSELQRRNGFYALALTQGSSADEIHEMFSRNEIETM